MDKIYILLPVHNRRNITQLFIECLKSQTYQNYHLILIDDGSTDGTEEMVHSRVQALTVIKGKGDWWWAGALQEGINWLKLNATNSDNIVLMINDDVTFDQFFLEKAAEILQHRQNFLLLAQCFSAQSGRCIDVGVKADLKSLSFQQATSSEEINCLSTMGLFLRFSELLRIGNFYPNLLPHYLSDYEFTIRAHKKGFALYTCPELKLWMNEETTGLRHFKEINFFVFMKRYFSKKSAVNPLSWTAFVILTCPKLWIPFNLLKIWWGTTTTIVKRALYICGVHLVRMLSLEKSA